MIFRTTPEIFQVREPVQFAGSQVKPLCQRADRFDRGNGPWLGRGHGLHLLRLGEPTLHGQFVAIFRPGSGESAVAKEELHYIAMARTRLVGAGADVSRGERRQPAGILAKRKRLARASNDSVNGGIPSQEGSG